MEEKFISLIHLNDLEIVFDFSDDYPGRLFYFYKKELILFIDEYRLFIVKSIWDFFVKFDNESYIFSPFLNDMLNKYFNTDKIDDSEYFSNTSSDYFEAWFKNNWFNNKL